MFPRAGSFLAFRRCHLLCYLMTLLGSRGLLQAFHFELNGVQLVNSNLFGATMLI